ERVVDAGTRSIEIEIEADKNVYLSTHLVYKTRTASAKSRGVKVKRNIYGKSGQLVSQMKRGEFYMVELLVDADKDVPFAVIDEALPAGVEYLRKDIVTTRKLVPFNVANSFAYRGANLTEEHHPERTVFYSYTLPKKTRVVYFVKAIYNGVFTWHPAKVEAMYHPKYFARTSTMRIEIK
ncbi:MAG: hypothetical protein GY757_58695, partial [bacterium]|nr:hypothetical protein [bacterium]